MTVDPHQRLVRLVMQQLQVSLEERGISEEALPPAPAAVRIVAKIMESDSWLIHGSRVHFVKHVQRDPSISSIPRSPVFVVYVTEDAAKVRCRWCGDPCVDNDPGTAYTLCDSCFRYGPPPSTNG